MRITSLAFVTISFFSILYPAPAIAMPVDELILSLEIQFIHLSQVINDAENERRYDLLVRAQVLLEKLKETLGAVIEQRMRQDPRLADELRRLDVLDFETLVTIQREAFSMLEKLEALVPRGTLPVTASKKRDLIDKLIAKASEILEATVAEFDGAREPANSYLRFSLYSRLSRVRDYLMTIKKLILEANFCTHRGVELFVENLELLRAGQRNVERVFETLTSILTNQETAMQPPAAAAADPTFTPRAERNARSTAAASEPRLDFTFAQTESETRSQSVISPPSAGDAIRTVIENAFFTFVLFLFGDIQSDPD